MGTVPTLTDWGAHHRCGACLQLHRLVLLFLVAFGGRQREDFQLVVCGVLVRPAPCWLVVGVKSKEVLHWSKGGV